MSDTEKQDHRDLAIKIIDNRYIHNRDETCIKCPELSDRLENSPHVQINSQGYISFRDVNLFFTSLVS